MNLRKKKNNAVYSSKFVFVSLVLIVYAVSSVNLKMVCLILVITIKHMNLI